MDIYRYFSNTMLTVLDNLTFYFNIWFYSYIRHVCS